MRWKLVSRDSVYEWKAGKTLYASLTQCVVKTTDTSETYIAYAMQFHPFNHKHQSLVHFYKGTPLTDDVLTPSVLQGNSISDAVPENRALIRIYSKDSISAGYLNDAREFVSFPWRAADAFASTPILVPEIQNCAYSEDVSRWAKRMSIHFDDLREDIERAIKGGHMC